MRVLFSSILLMASFVLFGQLTIKPIQKNKSFNEKHFHKAKSINPASLPFWDDFSITENNVDSIRVWGNDTTTQWNHSISKDVFVNATLAINPPTYKVITFDGLDANGAFHLDNELKLADQLQSDTIDLSSFQEEDNIYISFYWQAGGNVEKPDEGDSLRLQFYNPLDSIGDKWTTIWAMEGDEQLQDSLFTQEINQVTEAFLTEKFVFRFQSFGDLNGPFDAWHIDWIYLNADRSEDDLGDGYSDASVSGQLSSPITPYNSIPANQFTSDNKFIENQSVSLSYLSLDPLQFYQLELNHIVRIINNNDVILNDKRGSNPLDVNSPFKTITLGLNDPGLEDALLNEQDFSSVLLFDSVIIESTVFFDHDDNNEFNIAGNIDLRVNDTIRTKYLLKDYYAYDDGSAEFAAGTNVLGGQIAVKFWLEEQDTLTHVSFHFPNISPSSDGKPITLNILKSLTDEIPLRSQQINIEINSKINGITTYELKRPLVVSDTFYISYQQNSNEYIGIGFDRSNPAASEYIFENNGDSWEQNVRLKGALMIRAIFEDIDIFTLGESKPQELVVFPNPTTGFLSIKGNYAHIEVMDVAGKLLLQENAKDHHDLSNLKVGLYLLKVRQSDGDRTYKIIKK